MYEEAGEMHLISSEGAPFEGKGFGITWSDMYVTLTKPDVCSMIADKYLSEGGRALNDECGVRAILV